MINIAFVLAHSLTRRCRREPASQVATWSRVMATSNNIRSEYYFHCAQAEFNETNYCLLEKDNKL